MSPKSQFLYGKLAFVKEGYRMGKASKSTFGLPVGSLKLFMESLPRPAKCTKNNVIFSNRYIHIPRTSKYPEKSLKL